MPHVRCLVPAKTKEEEAHWTTQQKHFLLTCIVTFYLVNSILKLKLLLAILSDMFVNACASGFVFVFVVMCLWLCAVVVCCGCVLWMCLCGCVFVNVVFVAVLAVMCCCLCCPGCALWLCAVDVSMWTNPAHTPRPTSS